MRASQLSLALLLINSLACNRSSTKAAGNRTEAQTPSQISGRATNATVPIQPAAGSAHIPRVDQTLGTSPGPLLLPAVVLPDGLVPIHATQIGWTTDGHWFGFCGAYGSGMAETRCTEVTVAGATRSVELAARRSHLSRPVDPTPPTWRYGGTIRFVWEVQPAAYLVDGPPHQGAAFVLSGGAIGEAALYVLDRLILEPENPDLSLHVDAISPSADGTALGAVIHGYSGEWTDTYHLRVWSTDDLAGRTFNAIGMSHHQSGRYRQAVEWFGHAMQAHKTPKASYNLACALARLADPRAEEAFHVALVIGGPNVVDKARKDRDFDKVRKETWFATLVR